MEKNIGSIRKISIRQFYWGRWIWEDVASQIREIYNSSKKFNYKIMYEIFVVWDESRKHYQVKIWDLAKILIGYSDNASIYKKEASLIQRFQLGKAHVDINDCSNRPGNEDNYLSLESRYDSLMITLMRNNKLSQEEILYKVKYLKKFDRNCIIVSSSQILF